LYNIENTNPSLIISPRRYGKTSLVLKALAQLNIAHVHVDFYKALSKEDIEIFILNGIGKLLGQLETVPKKLMSLANEFFSNMKIQVVLKEVGIALDFSKRSETITASLILEALERLQALAHQKNKEVVVFFDEFQAIGDVTKDYYIEAVIREAAQKSTNVAYIFSGSNRHLMEQMFYDKKRPFYKLCDLIVIDRISYEDYEAYIQHAALQHWKNKLDNDVIEAILSITERHAYYVNKLCSLLWQGDSFGKENVAKAWEKLVLENKSLIERELELLSINQRRILILLSNHKEVKEPYSKDFVTHLNLPISSIARSLSGLIAKDYVYISKECYYKILDPLIKSILENKDL
jgi:uncharacterized protein